jgi:BMFP domain-containing protein YqiC
MSKEMLSEIREKLYVLERKIKPLEWDSSRQQINEFKKVTLAKLREEHIELTAQLSKLERI